MNDYRDLQQQLARGWNTWNVRSVLSHVLLPDGFALNLALREYQSGRYLKEALIGRFQGDLGFAYRGGEPVEVITPGPHAYDGSYTELHLAWRGIELTVQTATDEEDLVILVTPLKNQKHPASLVVETGILWNRPGSIERDGETLAAHLPGRELRVHTTKAWLTDPYVAAQTPYAAMRLDEVIGVSTGRPRSLAEIRTVIAHRQGEHAARKARYGELADVYDALQSCLAWATLYEPSKDRVIATISRTWDVDRNFGGYLVAQDLFYHAYIASVDNRELAYACAVEMVKEKTPTGFVPFSATGAGFVSLDKTSPPLAGIIIWELFRHYRDQWLVAEVFDDLLAWNRWCAAHRQVGEGLMGWGSNAYEPVFDNFFELEGVNQIFAAKLESGYDNSTAWDDVRFDPDKGVMKYADVAFTSLHIADCDALANMADLLGRPAEAAELRARSARCAAGLQGLWDEPTGMFLNRHTETGEPSWRLTPGNFYPLLTGAVTRAQAERMVNEHFYNPEEFRGAWMLPCAARNDPGYQDQYYWRGRIWGPTNFWTYLGLRRYGFAEAATELADKSARLLLKEWLEHGHVHENYHAELGIGCDDAKESEKLYTWSGLFGTIALLEAGFMGPIPEVVPQPSAR